MRWTTDGSSRARHPSFLSEIGSVASDARQAGVVGQTHELGHALEAARRLRDEILVPDPGHVLAGTPRRPSSIAASSSTQFRRTSPTDPSLRPAKPAACRRTTRRSWRPTSRRGTANRRPPVHLAPALRTAHSGRSRWRSGIRRLFAIRFDTRHDPAPSDTDRVERRGERAPRIDPSRPRATGPLHTRLACTRAPLRPAWGTPDRSVVGTLRTRRHWSPRRTRPGALEMAVGEPLGSTLRPWGPRGSGRSSSR